MRESFIERRFSYAHGTNRRSNACLNSPLFEKKKRIITVIAYRFFFCCGQIATERNTFTLYNKIRIVVNVRANLTLTYVRKHGKKKHFIYCLLNYNASGAIYNLLRKNSTHILKRRYA